MQTINATRPASPRSSRRLEDGDSMEIGIKPSHLRDLDVFDSKVATLTVPQPLSPMTFTFNDRPSTYVAMPMNVTPR